MNKLLMFPLAVMFMVSMFIFVSLAVSPVTETGNYSNTSGIIIDDEEHYIDSDSGKSQSIELWAVGAFLILLGIALAAGIVSGISFVGSGLTDTSQKMIFLSIMFLGLWGALTVISTTIFFDNIIMTVIWLNLSFTFVVGLAFEINGD